MEIKDYYIRLMGTAYIDEPLEIDNNYRIACEGEIVSSTEQTNEDGTGKKIFKFKPTTIEIIKDNGVKSLLLERNRGVNN
jgi:hypothetical protein